MKAYRRALVVGKFSPLHQGHQLLLDTASAAADELVIISYSLPEYAGCCALTRKRWLRQCYPHAHVFCFDAAQVWSWCLSASQPWYWPLPDNAADEHLQRDFCAQLLANKQLWVDVVFSSEDYGDGFAAYLTEFQRRVAPDWLAAAVVHHCVDKTRRQVAMSGTHARQYYRQSLPLNPLVAAQHQVPMWLFLGAESTGKSTLSSWLASTLAGQCAQEYGRELWLLRQGELSEQDYWRIAQRQRLREVRLRAQTTTLLCCDSSPLTTLFYFQQQFAYSNLYLAQLARRAYHRVYLCVPDFAMVQDGTRQDEDFRQHQHQWYLQMLREWQIDYQLLSGSLVRRQQQLLADWQRCCS